MQATATVFLLAGYNTTSTALAFTTYSLAVYPDIQEKLQEEIDHHFHDKVVSNFYFTWSASLNLSLNSNKILKILMDKNKMNRLVNNILLFSLQYVQPDFKTVDKLPYLDAIIREVLRIYCIGAM